MLGFAWLFKTSFFAFIFFIMRRIKSRFSVLWDFLSAVSVKVWKEMLLLFSCVIFSYVTLILSCAKKWSYRFCGLSSFLAACYHLPVWDYFYPLFQPLDPRMLQEHQEPQHCLEFSSDANIAPFQMIPKRSLDQLNCSVASSISYWTSISLASVGAGSELNWILGR